MESNISDLPQEVLTHIFYYLDVPDRLKVGRVCKQWLEASNTNLLLEDARFICVNENSLQKLLVSTRTFTRITLLNLRINCSHLSLLQSLSPKIRHLQLHHCNAYPAEKTVKFPNLHTLEVLGDADVLSIFSPLPNLKHLDLHYATNLTDRNWIEVLDHIVGFDLESFSMPNQMVFNIIVFKRYYPSLNFEFQPSDAFLSFEVVHLFVKRRVGMLTELEFSEKISREAAIRISKIKDLKLRHVSFRGCLECTRGVLPEVCRNQPSLVSVNVNGVLNLLDEDVIGMCQALPNLRKFTARTCRNLNSCIISLFSLKRLHSVDLHGCRITSDSFCEAIRTFEAKGLRYLGLGQTNLGSALLDLFPLVPRLRSLDLEMCFHLPNSMNADTIYKCLPMLKDLRGYDASTNCKFAKR